MKWKEKTARAKELEGTVNIVEFFAFRPQHCIDTKNKVWLEKIFVVQIHDGTTTRPWATYYFECGAKALRYKEFIKGMSARFLDHKYSQ